MSRLHGSQKAAALLAIFCLLLSLAAPAWADIERSNPPATDSRSIADRSLTWPTWQLWFRVFTLQDYNTRVVIQGTALLGCAGGMVGSFTLLRKRALMGDALSHATLPGLCLAFIIATSLGMDGKALPVLLAGAIVSGLLGVGSILAFRNLTRLKEDTALGAVLSVFFGAGIALMGLIQQMPEGHAAGLESFIYGKTASMGRADIQLITVAATVCILTCGLLFKELKLLCFDEQFAGSRGFPIVWLDVTLMAMVVVITIVGLQAVGLILMIALMVIPAAAARFWTERLGLMFLISGMIGAFSGMAGAAASALFSKLPSGAMIVLVCTGLFLLSMTFGSARGVLVRFLRRRSLQRSIDRQHLLRAIYESLETAHGWTSSANVAGRSISVDELLNKRSWSRSRLDSEIRRCHAAELVESVGPLVRLTRRGVIEAERLTRQHRLWELYLITHADIAPSRVDQDADRIEHVLEPEIVAELESLLLKQQRVVPESPHDLTKQPGTAALGAAPTISQADGETP